MARPKKPEPLKSIDKPISKVGRPKAIIDWEEVEGLIQAGSSGVEIAHYYGVDKKTLYNRCESDNNISFSVLYRQNISRGNAMLRQATFQAALKGGNNSFYASNLIFLAKSRLGMSDKPKDETGSGTITLNINKGNNDAGNA